MLTLAVLQLTLTALQSTLATLLLTLALSNTVVAGVALDGKRCWVVQLFHYINLGGFFLLAPVGECNTHPTAVTTRANPPTTGDGTEQHTHPIGSKKYARKV
jgi:hypothetical protein